MFIRPRSYALSFARECREKARTCSIQKTRQRYEALAADYERIGAQQQGRSDD